MAKNYDKPFLNYEEQIEYVKSKNIIIRDTDFVLEALNSISFHTLLLGYSDTFLRDEHGDQFKSGTTFEMIYDLHQLDLDLANLLFKYILMIENSLKTKLSHIVSQQFGVDEMRYLSSEHYSSSFTNKNAVISDLKHMLRNAPEGSSVAHYRTNHNHTPAWILVNDISFSLIIRWFQILKDSEKNYITNRFFRYFFPHPQELERDLMSCAFTLLKEYRNHIAHGKRTYFAQTDISLPKKSLLAFLSNGTLAREEFDNGLGTNDFFAVLILIFLMINEEEKLHHFLQELDFIFAYYHDLRPGGMSIYDALNIPNDYRNRLEPLLKKFQNEKTNSKHSS